MSFNPLLSTSRTASPGSSSKPSSPAPRHSNISSNMDIGISEASSSSSASGIADTSTGFPYRGGTTFEVPLLPVRQIPCVHCGQPARVGSKYCSKACGVSIMLEKVKQEKANEEAERKKARFERRCAVIWSEIEQDIKEKRIKSISELDDVKAMDEVEEEKRTTEISIESIKKQQIDLEELITKGSSLAILEESEMDEVVSISTARTTHLDCPYCGAAQPSAAASMSHHMSACFQKFESSVPLMGSHPTPPNDVNSLIYCDAYDAKTNQYCKKLKASCFQHSGVLPSRTFPAFTKVDASNSPQQGPTKNQRAATKDKKKEKPTHAALAALVCGSPTTDDPSGFCRLNRRDCPRHHNWDNIARRQLELQLISLNQLLEALRQESVALKERMIMRRLCRGLQGSATTIPGPAALSQTSQSSPNAMDVS